MPLWIICAASFRLALTIGDALSSSPTLCYQQRLVLASCTPTPYDPQYTIFGAKTQVPCVNSNCWLTTTSPLWAVGVGLGGHQLVFALVPGVVVGGCTADGGERPYTKERHRPLYDQTPPLLVMRKGAWLYI